MSPVLPNTPGAFDEVDDVADILRDGDGDLGACVSFNKNCAFQVHVGRRDNLDFPLPMLQKLASLLWMGAEELLDLVHPEPRVRGHWCRSLRADSALARNLASDENNGVRDDDDDDAETEEQKNWVGYCSGARGGGDGDGDDDERAAPASPTDIAGLKAIWQAQTTGELCGLVSHTGRHMAYDFARLAAAAPAPSRPGPRQDKGFKRTIEFRQAHGDLRHGGGGGDIVADPGYAATWAAVATALVAFAGGAGGAALGRVVRETRAGLGELQRMQSQGIFAAAACRGEIVERFLLSIGVSYEAAVFMSRRAVVSR